MSTNAAYICVHCGQHVQSLINKLGKSEYALQTCPACKGFCDPYIENDTLSVFIDLLLAKKSVYRHLMLNLEKRRNYFYKLAFVVVLAGTYLTWSKTVLHTGHDWGDVYGSVLRPLSALIITQFLAIVCCKIFKPSIRGSSVSEALFLSSITRLFFMSLALIWPEGFTSQSFEVPRQLWPYADPTVNTHDVLLAGLEMFNRGIAFAVLLANDLAGFVVGFVALGAQRAMDLLATG
ncbi:hypothetical protein P389DRAFT_109426 [Cystobasidium minutum MCA 4210]|uniref:uncharacterized protein n=1 Tax=Cystobasidium minutum MCA 4210 TaxID=1397322 RepID=UPI0034CD959D|eukprot:jgi/Rhomi1/109426/CE109425_1043